MISTTAFILISVLINSGIIFVLLTLVLDQKAQIKELNMRIGDLENKMPD